MSNNQKPFPWYVKALIGAISGAITTTILSLLLLGEGGWASYFIIGGVGLLFGGFGALIFNLGAKARTVLSIVASIVGGAVGGVSGLIIAFIFVYIVLMGGHLG